MINIRNSLAWKLTLPVPILLGVAIAFLMIYVPMQLRSSTLDNAVAVSQGVSWTIGGTLVIALIAMLVSLVALYRKLVGKRLEKLKGSCLSG